MSHSDQINCPACEQPDGRHLPGCYRAETISRRTTVPVSDVMDTATIRSLVLQLADVQLEALQDLIEPGRVITVQIGVLT